jgi:NAD(P)H-dependent FMN reductase
MDAQPRIGIIVSSTRPTRICKNIAQWVLEIAQEHGALVYQLIDLADVGLPFLDEPLPPATGHYQHEHTKAWSQQVSACAGFILVVPQYNWGYPAPLKNALDFLYAEWASKPVSIVSYGSHGGGKATEQLKVVLQGLHMRNTVTNPALSIADEMVDAEGQLKDITTDFAPFKPDVAQTIGELVTMLTIFA